MKSDIKEYGKVIKAFEIKVTIMERDLPRRRKDIIGLHKTIRDYGIQIQELEEAIATRLAKNGKSRKSLCSSC